MTGTSNHDSFDFVTDLSNLNQLKLKREYAKDSHTKPNQPLEHDVVKVSVLTG